jgi:hypothetical protein
MTATIRLATDTSEKVRSAQELAWITDSGDPVYYADLRLVDKFPDLMSIVEVPPVGTFAVFNRAATISQAKEHACEEYARATRDRISTRWQEEPLQKRLAQALSGRLTV